MIVRMTHVRLAGPSVVLEGVLRLVQDLGVLHVVRPRSEAFPAERWASAAEAKRKMRRGEATQETATQETGTREAGEAETEHLRRIVEDCELALKLLEWPDGKDAVDPPALASAARLARRARRKAAALATRTAALEDERVMLLRYRDFFAAFTGLLGHELSWPDGQAFYVVLRKGAAGAVLELRKSLEAAVGKEVELQTEGAEVYYRNVEIAPIDAMPPEFAEN